MGFCVDLLRERESVATRFGQSDQLFEPRGSGGLEMHSRAELLERSTYGRIDGEFIAAGVDAELERRGQAEVHNCIRDHSDIVFEFAMELWHVADVIDALVEAAGEFGRDSLDRNLLRGHGGENHQQLGWSLR